MLIAAYGDAMHDAKRTSGSESDSLAMEDSDLLSGWLAFINVPYDGSYLIQFER